MKALLKITAASGLIALFALTLTESAFGLSFGLTDRVTGKPIPNMFWLNNNLPIFEPDVQLQDPDGDGFLNEDEWRHETNPQDKNSQPPYYTKLFLVARVGQALRLKFMAFDGKLKEAGLKEMTFQINAWAGKWRTIFIRPGKEMRRSICKS